MKTVFTKERSWDDSKSKIRNQGRGVLRTLSNLYDGVFYENG